VQTEKGSVIKKSPKYGVGKQVGNTIYLHKSVEDRLPHNILNNIKDTLPTDFTYDIVKYDEKNGNITFISSPDWDTSEEPLVGDAILIRGDGSKRYMKQKSSPQIYHHKWLFVNDDYGGFNVKDSIERSEKWLKIPNIEFNKIGYKNYWESNVIPQINENYVMKKELIVEMSYTDISDEEIMKANKSSRSSGAVGPKALTPRMVLQYIKDTGNKNVKILDFGSGKDAKHTYSLRDMGLDVTAHDFSANINDEHHDPNALGKTYDIVFASNVLNVQGSENMMRRTVEDILKTISNDSVFIANFPSSPRYGFETAKQAKDILEDYFDVVVIHGSDGGRTSSPVWAMTKKTEIVESFKWGDMKKQLLKEDKVVCPEGFIFDDEVDNCVRVIELPEINVMSFENDSDGNIRKSFNKYDKRLMELEILFDEEGTNVDDKFYYENLKKPKEGYTVEFFDNLYNLVNTEFVEKYKTFEIYRREKFIEDMVRPMVGKPYVWGEMGPEFNDCSGLMCHVFERGWKHNAQMLYDKSNNFKSLNKAKVGDIIYFNYDPDNDYDEINNPTGDKNPIDHVGVISKREGNKLWMIHASGDSNCTKERYEKKKDKYGKKKSPKKCVVKEVMLSNYWRKNKASIGRLNDYNF
jgi:hypothetical protein